MTDLSKKDFLATQSMGEVKSPINLYTIISLICSFVGVKIVRVQDVTDTFHFAKHKSAGTWINTGTFVQVSRQTAAEGNWAKHDWIVKVDMDVVFFAYLLVEVRDPEGDRRKGLLRKQQV